MSPIDFVKEHPKAIGAGVFFFVLILIVVSRKGGADNSPEAMAAALAQHELDNKNQFDLAKLSADVQSQGIAASKAVSLGQTKATTAQTRIAANAQNLSTRLGAQTQNLATKTAAQVDKYNTKLNDGLAGLLGNLQSKTQIRLGQIQHWDDVDTANINASNQPDGGDSFLSGLGSFAGLGALALL